MARNLDYDWFIVDPNDMMLQSNMRRDPDVGPTEALNFIRLLTTGKNIFLATPRLRVDEGSYHVYRARVLFPEFQCAWTAAAYSALPTEVSDQLGSLGQRLRFILQAVDQVSYHSLKQANNNTEDHIIYHLAYLVMLATGVFDDLAWTLRFLYSLPLDNFATVLKSPDKSKPRLLDALITNNAQLHAYLSSASVQSKIRMFYPFRDQLQHRQFVTGGLIVNGRSTPRILLAVDRDAYSQLPQTSAAGPRESWGVGERDDQEWMDPYWFVRTALESVADIVNGVLGRIDWKSYLQTLPTDKRVEAEGLLAHGPEDAGRALGWGHEPVYFWAQ